MARAAKAVIWSSIIPALLLTWWWYTGHSRPAGARVSQIPPLGQVINAASEEISSGYLREQVAPSLRRYFPGLLLGCSIGLLLGLATGRIGLLDRAMSPSINLTRAMPPIALAPFFIMLFGLNDWTRIGVIAYGTTFPVFVSTYAACKRLPVSLRETADSLGFSSSQRLVLVTLPAIAPSIAAGCRISIGMGWVMLFIAEWIGASDGIGYRLAVAHTVSRVDYMIWGLFVLGTLSVLTDAIFRVCCAHFISWTDR